MSRFEARSLAEPIVLAPLAGGPSTVELALAVSEAGGLGFLAAGYRSAAEMADQVEQLRARSAATFGVNVFVPGEQAADPASYGAYLERIAAEGERLGVAPGEPRFERDDYDEKLAALAELGPAVVSFTFGCPDPDAVAALQAVGSAVWVTVTSPAEAQLAAAAGADALVVQGAEAGGHRGGWLAAGEGDPSGLLVLLQLIGARLAVPLVAAGGIATGAGIAAALAAGADAAQLGTAFLRCPEAGTAAVQREALAREAPTALTRAFTGRQARGIVNRFMREHEPAAVDAYPEIHHATAPLRRAGRERGDADVVNLWAGQAHELGTELPAGELVRSLGSEARAALRRARERRTE